VWPLVNCKNGISSCEIAGDLGITLYFVDHRLQVFRHRAAFSATPIGYG
jgi:hypothetical protein